MKLPFSIRPGKAGWKYPYYAVSYIVFAISSISFFAKCRIIQESKTMSVLPNSQKKEKTAKRPCPPGRVPGVVQLTNTAGRRSRKNFMIKRLTGEEGCRIRKIFPLRAKRGNGKILRPSRVPRLWRNRPDRVCSQKTE